MRGLCFSGGGIKVASHIGALKALEEKKRKIFLDKNKPQSVLNKLKN